MDYQAIGVACLAVAILVLASFQVWPWFSAWLDVVDGEYYSNELFDIYDQIWSGDPADRVTAWFRTIDYLERNNFPEEMITEARLHKMFESRKGENSSYNVSSNGKLIRVNERGGAANYEC